MKKRELCLLLALLLLLCACQSGTPAQTGQTGKPEDTEPEGAEEAGVLPLLPQPASRVSASVAEARMVQNFFIQIFLSES